MKKPFFFLCVLFSFALSAAAQKMTQQEYIDRYKEFAIAEMYRSGVPASITLAQGLLETESGNSPLVLRSNNHFGIKCKSTWNGPSVSHDDDEKDECFRAYATAEESYRDHSDFLRGNVRYAFLFDLEPTNYREWAHGLKKAGYATNPRYPEMLIRFIEANNLQQYDTEKYIVKTLTDEEIAPPAHVAASLPVHEQKTPMYADFSSHVINGSKAIYVPAGTSLLAFASKHKIRLPKLLELNDLKTDGLLSKAQFIFLEKKAAEGATDFYSAEGGETPYDVSQQKGILLQSVLTFNAHLLEHSILQKGQRVSLRKSASTAIQSDTPASVPQKVQATHTVAPKEGLYAISKRYGVSIDELKAWNNLSGDQLQIGQQLKILN